jgi:hypothetical protein
MMEGNTIQQQGDVKLDNSTNAEIQKLDLLLKQLEVEEKQRQLEYIVQSRAKDEQDKLNLEKLQTLNYLLQSTTVDMERTIIGSETFQRPIYSEREEALLREKVMEIVKRL